MVYQPMLEVLAYLRANGFKTYIRSGGGIEFMRPWTERVYGIPPEQVIGSSIKTRFEMRDGEPVIVRIPELNFIDDKAGKPAAIQHHIGRRPIAASATPTAISRCCNGQPQAQGRDLPCTCTTPTPSAEWAYDRTSHIGKLDKGLDEAAAKGWTVVDMKKDSSVIYAFEKR